MIKHTETIVWVCLTILWDWRLKGWCGFSLKENVLWKEGNGKFSTDKNRKILQLIFPLFVARIWRYYWKLECTQKSLIFVLQQKIDTVTPIWRKEEKICFFYVLPELTYRQQHILTPSIDVARKSAYVFIGTRQLMLALLGCC